MCREIEDMRAKGVKQRDRRGDVASADAKLIADRLEQVNASIGELTDAVTALAVLLQGHELPAPADGAHDRAVLS
jgi:hypothetical protein